MDRVFLDSNVLFSASYCRGAIESGIRQLPDLPGVESVTSAYALVEAGRNLPTEEQRTRLAELAVSIRLVPDVTGAGLDLTGVALPDKDVPILLAAIHARATHLVTGDRMHFGPLYGRVIGGVMIVRPGEYMATAMASQPSTSRPAKRMRASRPRSGQ